MNTSLEGNGNGKPARPARGRDLRYRIAYTKPELSLLLPYGHTTLEEMIKKGMFPDGMRPHPTAHKIWSRAVIEGWLERTSSRNDAAESSRRPDA